MQMKQHSAAPRTPILAVQRRPNGFLFISLTDSKDAGKSTIPEMSALTNILPRSAPTFTAREK